MPLDTSRLAAGWRRWRTALSPRPRWVYMGGFGVATTWRGDRVLVPAGDWGLPPYLATSGRWEPAVERLLQRLARPGAVAADCGANVGYHALGLAHAVGPRGRVHAFEANPRLAPLLARTVEMAGFAGRIRLHAAAVADRGGSARFAVDPAWSAGGHLAWEGTGAAYSQAVEVPLVRLDDALAEVAALDVLRMDVEGAEGLALAGAEALIARSPRLSIVTEWDTASLRARCDPAAVAGGLAAQGFRAQVIDPRGRLHPTDVRALGSLDTTRTTNLLLTRG